NIFVVQQPAHGINLVDDGIGYGHVSGIVVTDRRIAMGAMSDQRGANTPLGDNLFQKAIARIIATHETDLDQPFAQGGFGIQNAFAGGCGSRQRLFTEHWLACCDRRQNEFFVGRTDGGDYDSLHVLRRDEGLPGAFGPAAKVLGNLLSPRRIDIGHCHHTSSGQRLSDAADMILPNVSSSNNSDSNSHFLNHYFALQTFSKALLGIWKDINRTSNRYFFGAAL